MSLRSELLHKATEQGCDFLIFFVILLANLSGVEEDFNCRSGPTEDFSNFGLIYYST